MPKVLEIDQFSDLSPGELEAAIKEQTRFSIAPYQGSPLVGGKPLKGRVKEGRVSVGLTERDWLTLMQPVFEGRIEPLASGGSRLVGRAGLPAFIVWAMRLTTALVVPAAIVAATWPMLSELGELGVVAAGLMATVMALGSVFGVGVNVAHAEKQLPQLEATLASIAGSPTPLGEGQASSTEEIASERARRAQAAESSRQS